MTLFRFNVDMTAVFINAYDLNLHPVCAVDVLLNHEQNLDFFQTVKLAKIMTSY